MEAFENNSTTRTGPKVQFYCHSLLQMQKKKKNHLNVPQITDSFHNMLSYKYARVAELNH